MKQAWILLLCVELATLQAIEFGCRSDRYYYCSGGWIQSGRKCFKLLTTLKTFDEADISCRNNQALLASLGSESEHTLLLDYILRDVREAELKSVWIGGKRKKTRYIWMDLEPFKYMDWHSGNADFIKYDINTCVQLQTASTTFETDQRGFGKFLLQPCATKNFYVCQRNAEMVMTRSGRTSNTEST